MDYNDFVDKENACKMFVLMRSNGFEALKTDVNKYVDYFTNLCELSVQNNCMAQDYIAYCYKTGIDNVIPVNYEKYMSYQILAGANGNCFALEKLEFFLRAGVDIIMQNKQVLKKAIKLGNINSDNGLLVIANLLCEGIVDELHITPEKLIKQKDIKSDYTPEKYRVYTRAMEKALVKVLDYLSK